MASFTLDSNILIYHLKQDAIVTRTLKKWLLAGEPLFISAITRIEVLAAPILKEEEEKQIIRLLEQFLLIPVDTRITDNAARIRRTYRLKLGDSIIAATALILNSILVTRNVRDFKRIKELQIQIL